MKSVDRDFDLNGRSGFYWPFVYLAMVLAAGGIVIKILYVVHHRGFDFYTPFQIVVIPLILIFPLIFSLRFKKYVRGALKESLISERVANNCGLFLGQQLVFVYIAIVILAMWN
jgi:hypothetical protein